MQHSIILRAAVALTVFLTLVAAGFGWIASHGARAASQSQATATSPAASGVDLYQARCSTCHGADGLSGWLDRNVGSDRETKLVEFLAKHGKTTGAENGAIAAYLMQATQPKP